MFFRQIISYLLVVVSFFANLFGLGTNPKKDTQEAYEQRLASISIYENTQETAVPMTKIYDIIKSHLESPLPEGKTQKKVLVLGYDGCRADNMSLLDKSKNSSVKMILGDGGKAYIAYCGGVNFPAENTQATSTAPGWCSMLTGQWADVHGITDNGQPKSNDHLTCLTTFVQNGLVDNSAFYVSWNGHFKGKDTTYVNEVEYVKSNGVDTSFVDAANDNGTFRNVMNDIKKQDCTDFIFSIFEYCDHAGHSSGFDLNNLSYRRGFLDADLAGYKILNAVKDRETYDQEDWLFIITADHGGYKLNHGGASLQERMMFIITSKDLAE